MSESLIARIFDIQGYSVHDGPGGRTTIFFKGCPLRCYWCCNPEGLRREKDVMYKRNNCIRCYRCTQQCPNDAIHITELGEFVQIDREKCHRCQTFSCVKECYHEGYKLAGKDYTLETLLKRVERDRRFWSYDGGVTLSGGEFMMQYPFVKEFLKKCKERYIHTAIETCGYAPTEHYLDVLPYVNWIFMDIKHMDPQKHKQATGVSNELILKNVAKVMENKREDAGMVIRIPVIIGYNDNEENITATANFVKNIGLDMINILPFHRLGSSKYEQLDISYRCGEMIPPEEKDMQRVKGVVEGCGVKCYVGNETPF